MAYFQYSFAQHLSRPATVQNNTQYPVPGGAFSILASPFAGEQINQNFYFLAAMANDTTIRLNLLEANAQTGYSVSTGYITYAARQETEGAFYSGVPLVITPSFTTATPYTFSVPLAFQVASGNGIVTLSNGSVDTVNSKYISTTFGSPGQTGPYANPTDLVAYLNSKLAFNSLNSANTYGFTGLAAPASITQTQWNATWGNLTAVPKSFYIYINDAKTVNAGVLVTMSQSIAWGTSMAVVAGIVQTAISSAIGGLVTIPVTTDGTYLTLAPTTDRASQGCYQLRIERVSGDTSSVLDWIGWLANTSSNFSETWNYQSLFQFVSSSVSSPTSISIQGAGPYATLTFKPQDSTGTVADFLASFGLPTNTTINYHTRLPLTSYNNKPLSYGGSLTVNNLTLTGTLNYSNGSTLTTQFSTQTSGFFDTSTTTPVHTSGRINFDGNLYATDVWATNTVHANQMVGHVLSTYLTNGTFDLGQTVNVQPPLWTTTASTVPTATPSATNITSVTPGNVSGGTTLRTNATPILIGNEFDAIFTKAGVNQQGVFFYHPFTIDSGSKNLYGQIQFTYQTNNYPNQGLSVYVYDVTNNALITPTVSLIPNVGNTIPSLFTSYFKFSSSASYQLVFYYVATDTTAFTMELAGVTVTDVRTVPVPRAEYYATSGTIPATTVQINFDTIVENVGGGVVTLGAGAWKYTASLPGVYEVTAMADSTNTVTAVVGTSFFALDLYKNGSVYERLGVKRPDATTTVIAIANGATTLRLAVNDFLDIRPVYSVSVGTPAFNVATVPVSPRVTITWIGF